MQHSHFGAYQGELGGACRWIPALKAGFRPRLDLHPRFQPVHHHHLRTLSLFGRRPRQHVAGFAVTLAIRLVLNLFTAVIVTRTFLYILVVSFSRFIENNRAILGMK